MRKTSLLLALLLPLSQLFAAEPKPLTLATVDQRTVTVDAVAIAKAAPDRLEWLIQIKTTRPTVKESRAAVDASLKRLLAVLKDLGVKDDALTIADVEQGRDIEWEDRKYVFKGFFSSLTVLLRITDFKLVEKINSEILIDDIVQVKWMDRKCDREGELRQKALADAAKVALKKAEILATSLGAKVGDVFQINETSFATAGGHSGNLSANYTNAQAVSVSNDDDEEMRHITEISVRASIKVTFELVK